jgi:hypothetical protein
LTESIESLETKLEAMTLQNVAMRRQLRELESTNQRLLTENNALRSGKLAPEDVRRIAENIGYQLIRFDTLPILGRHVDIIASGIAQELGPAC